MVSIWLRFITSPLQVSREINFLKIIFQFQKIKPQAAQSSKQKFTKLSLANIDLLAWSTRMIPHYPGNFMFQSKFNLANYDENYVESYVLSVSPMHSRFSG